LRAKRAAEEQARKGAGTRLEVVQRYAAAAPAAASLDKPLQVRVATPADALRRSRTQELRTVLTLDGVSLDHTEDFWVHVFLNKPDAAPSTPVSDPSFVGSFAATVQRLGLEGGPLAFSLVLVPFPQRVPRTRTLTVGALEVGLVRSTVTKG
jgi:hypothetical protein